MSQEMIWFIIGVVCIVSETIIPGGIIAFLGFAAVLVGSMLHFGFIATTTQAMLTWFVSSIAMLFILRSFFMKFFEGDSQIHETEEDAESIGKIVEVIEEIQPFHEGRIRYLDTTWQARSEEDIPEGAKAIITKRDGNVWIVKSLEIKE